MAVTIPNSAGYAGDVNATEWAEIIPHAGQQYGVVDEASWVATPGASDREVRLSAGTGYGGGILDQTTAEASLVLPASASGSVYHLIHVHRDWNAARSVFTSKAGTGEKRLPGRDTNPGQVDDQPLWLARVDAGKSQVQELVDLRVWGGGYASDELVLQYLNFLGARVRVGSSIWERVLNSLGQPTWVRETGFTPVGSVIPFAGAAAPAGWLFCDGRAVKQSDYPALYAVIGAPWKANTDGTFTLPSMGGRVPAGTSASDGDFSLGRAAGAKTHQLSAAEMPQHTHYIDGPIGGQLSGTNGGGSGGNGAGYAPWFGGGFGAQPGGVTAAGGNQPHNNLQPYIALNYIIRAL